jgi:hypothetical protein
MWLGVYWIRYRISSVGIVRIVASRLALCVHALPQRHTITHSKPNSLDIKYASVNWMFRERYQSKQQKTKMK